MARPRGKRINLRAWREYMDWSQDDLAEASHLDKTTIKNIESGGGASTDALQKLTKAFRLRPGVLASGATPGTQRSPFAKTHYHEPDYLTDAAVVALVLEHWNVEVSTLQQRDAGHGSLMPQPTRNSNRWHITGPKHEFFLREVLNKAYTTPGRTRAKFRAVNWLNKRFDARNHSGLALAIPAPLSTRDNRSCESPDGAIFELYEFIHGGRDYTKNDRERYQTAIIHMLVELIQASSELEAVRPDLWQDLRGRYDHADEHQFRKLPALVSPRQAAARVDTLVGQLEGRADEDELITMVANGIKTCMHDRAQRKPPAPERWFITHGDMTENNFLLTDAAVYLLDWDSIRLMPCHFDLAFALMRLSLPRRDGTPPNPREDGEFFDCAKAFLDEFRNELRIVCSEELTDWQLAAALEAVRYEFAMRMLWHLEMLADSPEQNLGASFMARCNPDRVVLLKEKLGLGARTAP